MWHHVAAHSLRCSAAFSRGLTRPQRGAAGLAVGQPLVHVAALRALTSSRVCACACLLLLPQSKEDAPSEQNTVVLKLKVECRRLADGRMENDKVYSGQLQVRRIAGTNLAAARCAVSCRRLLRAPSVLAGARA